MASLLDESTNGRRGKDVDISGLESLTQLIGDMEITVIASIAYLTMDVPIVLDLLVIVPMRVLQESCAIHPLMG